MKRYEDDYRSSDSRRRGEPRDDRHPRERLETRDRRAVDDHPSVRETRGVEPRDRMDTTMDTRIPRVDPIRANAAARVEPRPERYGMEPRPREPEFYKDPRTGELRDARTGELYQEPAPRPAFPRDDRLDRDRMERDDIPIPPSSRRTREVVDLAPPREYEEEYRPSKYNDYFVPGTGLDREVIQHEICRYLGNDATVRPFTNKDGRQGFIVRAYRALTSAMIEDLKRDSSRWRQEQDRRQRAGRTTVSYSEMKGRQEVESYGEPMEVDDDYGAPPPSRRLDLDPRNQPVSRHNVTPVSSGYPSEPGYYVPSTQPSNYGPESLPRSHGEYRTHGGSTPPTTRAGQPGYGQPTYPSRTSATVPPVPVSSFRDPRTGNVVGYEQPYPAETRRRHQ